MSKTHIGRLESRKLQTIRDTASDLRVPTGSWGGILQGAEANVIDRQEDDGTTTRTVLFSRKVGKPVITSEVVITLGSSPPAVQATHHRWLKGPEDATTHYDSANRDGNLYTFGFPAGIVQAARTLRQVRDMQATLEATYHAQDFSAL